MNGETSRDVFLLQLRHSFRNGKERLEENINHDHYDTEVLEIEDARPSNR